MPSLKVEQFMDTILEKLEISALDDSLTTLKGHFLCEELLTEYLELSLCCPKHVLQSNFGFYNKLMIARSASNSEINSQFHWASLETLNTIRNKYAHLEKDKEKIRKQKEGFITSVFLGVKRGRKIELPLIENNEYKTAIVLVAGGLQASVNWVGKHGST